MQKSLEGVQLIYLKIIHSVGYPLFSLWRVTMIFAYFSLLICFTNIICYVLVTSSIHDRNLQFQPKPHTVSKAAETEWEHFKWPLCQHFSLLCSFQGQRDRKWSIWLLKSMAQFLAHIDKYWSYINSSGEAVDGSLSNTYKVPTPFYAKT